MYKIFAKGTKDQTSLESVGTENGSVKTLEPQPKKAGGEKW